MFGPKAGLSLQTQLSPLYPLLSLSFPESFTVERLIMPSLQLFYEFIGAVASRCFPRPTLSFASEQTLKDLKRSQGHREEVRRVDLANWAVRTSPKFATGVKYQFHQGFWPEQRSRRRSTDSSSSPHSLPNTRQQQTAVSKKRQCKSARGHHSSENLSHSFRNYTKFLTEQ